jgi:hypothetical protein
MRLQAVGWINILTTTFDVQAITIQLSVQVVLKRHLNIRGEHSDRNKQPGLQNEAQKTCVFHIPAPDLIVSKND